MKKFRASKSRSQGREGWCAIFYHPLRLDTRGQPTRIRRGLSTRDEAEAELLVSQLNKLLQDDSYWKISAKERASKIFDNRIISIFYGGIMGREKDSWAIREEIIPIPTPEDDYARVFLVGPTGAGKTTLLRQLIGTGPDERFPSTSTARTTIFDIEIILDDCKEFKAVVSFLSRDFVRLYLEDCITAAISAAIEGKNENEILRKFMEHSELRFRLSYLLGTLRKPTGQEEIDDYDLDDELTGEEYVEDDKGLPSSDREKLEIKLRGYLDRIIELSEIVKNEVSAQLNENLDALKEGDREALIILILEGVEKFTRNNNLGQSFVKDVFSEIESKFDLFIEGEFERDQTNWPVRWKFNHNDRSIFIKTVNWFSSNYAPNFGRLLTPLVDGMRVSGPFRPSWANSGGIPKLVFIDGEGLGHTPESAVSLPTSITKRYSMTEIVLLVDNAQQPMQAAAQSVLRSLAASGHISKMGLVFTHFDIVKGDNLPDTKSKINHVKGSLDGVIDTINRDVGTFAGRRLKRQIETSTFFVGNIQEMLPERASFTRNQLLKLVELFKSSITPKLPIPFTPIYDLANLVISIHNATNNYHSYWKAKLGLEYKPDIFTAHWTRIKALSRRFALQWQDHYDTLRPVADLIKFFQERLASFIAYPRDWKPQKPSEEQFQDAIERVSQEVYSRLHTLTQDRLFREHLNEWSIAYDRSGTGSARIRSRDIQGIYEVVAPMPNEMPSPESIEFLDKIRELFKESAIAAGAEVI